MTQSNTKSTSSAHTPSYNTQRHDQGVAVHIDLPGVRKEDVTITTEHQQLHVTAARQNAIPESWTLLNQTERPNAYVLKLKVHQDLDLANTAAQFSNGVLSLQINKRKESLPRQIEIEE